MHGGGEGKGKKERERGLCGFALAIFSLLGSGADLLSSYAR